MTITIVIINPQTENEAGCVNDVMPGRDGPENLRILKRVSWDWAMEAEIWVSAIEAMSWVFYRCGGDFSGLDRRRWIQILNITRCAARWDGVSIVKSVSLSSCRYGLKLEINKPFVPETTECACMCKCVCITVVIGITKLYNINAYGAKISLCKTPATMEKYQIYHRLTKSFGVFVELHRCSYSYLRETIHWRSRDEFINYFLLWTPTYRHTSVD